MDYHAVDRNRARSKIDCALDYATAVNRGGPSWLWADQIHYSQVSIRATFRDGRPLEHLVAELRRDDRCILSIGPLNVVSFMGRWFTRDNRRLFAIKNALAHNCLVPVAVGAVDYRFLSHFTTSNGGTAIHVRGAPPAHTSHACALGHWCPPGPHPRDRGCSRTRQRGPATPNQQLPHEPGRDRAPPPPPRGQRCRAILARIDLQSTVPRSGQAWRWHGRSRPRARKHRGKRGGTKQRARRR